MESKRESEEWSKRRQGYTETLLSRHSLSNVVRELLLHVCIDVGRYCWTKEATVNKFLCIDEYLKRNVCDLEMYELKPAIYLDGNNYNYSDRVPNSVPSLDNRSIISICPFESLRSNCLFNLYTDGYPGELHYKLKTSMTLSELIEQDLGVISFDINPSFAYNGESYPDGFEAVKHYLKNNFYCMERYTVSENSKHISASVYDVDSAIKLNDEDPMKYDINDIRFYPFPSKKNKTSYELKAPDIFNDKNRVFNVDLYEKDGKFVAYYTCGQGYVTEEIPGRTIYAAYYKFMVEKGFFDKSLIDKKSIWQLG